VISKGVIPSMAGIRQEARSDRVENNRAGWKTLRFVRRLNVSPAGSVSSREGVLPVEKNEGRII
jgi:hypothetical protein